MLNIYKKIFKNSNNMLFLVSLFSSVICVFDYQKYDFSLWMLIIQYASLTIKLDWIAPLITDPPPTSFTTLLNKGEEKKKKKNKWHLTHYTWHVSHDKWHLTYATEGVVNIVSKFQVPSSNGLGVMMLWGLGGKGSLSDSIS